MLCHYFIRNSDAYMHGFLVCDGFAPFAVKSFYRKVRKGHRKVRKEIQAQKKARLRGPSMRLI
jgi:hypothetical protein